MNERERTKYKIIWIAIVVILLCFKGTWQMFGLESVYELLMEQLNKYSKIILMIILIILLCFKEVYRTIISREETIFEEESIKTTKDKQTTFDEIKSLEKQLEDLKLEFKNEE